MARVCTLVMGILAIAYLIPNVLDLILLGEISAVLDEDLERFSS